MTTPGHTPTAPTAHTPTAHTPTAQTPTAQTPTAQTPTAQTPIPGTPTAHTATAGTPGRLGTSARTHRRVTSFVRRSTRMTPAQRRAWESYRDRWVLDVPRGETSTSVAPQSTLDLTATFGRSAPLVVEIGPGMGDSLAPMAVARPDLDIVAFEVFEPAIAALLARLATNDVGNVRIASVDAVDGFAHLLPPGCVHEIWMFFPDPWRKARHHKRRLLSPRFADLVATRLRPGGRWRLATDWADYAAQMGDVLDHHPEFCNEYAASEATPRWAARPVTRFEQRGLDAGRTIADFCYRRIDPAAARPAAARPAAARPAAARPAAAGPAADEQPS